MGKFLVLAVLLLSGCSVVGSAYVETDRPEGKAVAKVEVSYSPPAR